MRVLIRDWLTSLPHHHHPHFQPLFSFLFLMSCSFPVKWIITVGIILVTWHYLDEVNNWNLCLKGFYLDERKGSAGRVGRLEREREGGGGEHTRLYNIYVHMCMSDKPVCQAGDTSHVNRFWLTSPRSAGPGTLHGVGSPQWQEGPAQGPVPQPLPPSRPEGQVRTCS